MEKETIILLISYIVPERLGPGRCLHTRDVRVNASWASGRQIRKVGGAGELGIPVHSSICHIVSGRGGENIKRFH